MGNFKNNIYLIIYIMDIPFINQPNYQSTNTSIGNSGNGSKVNKPTIPRIDYNPTTEFIVGRYNNNIQPTVLSTLFTNTEHEYYNTNNPISGNDWVNNRGLNGAGSNRGSHYRPNQWTPYVLNDSQIPHTNPTSQTFAYNENSINIQGSTTRAWVPYMSTNVNNSSGLEQITPQNETVPQERTDEDMHNEAVKILKDEMD